MEPGGLCPSAGGNPESSAPLGACRQEVGSLCHKGTEQRGEVIKPYHNREYSDFLYIYFLL